nr:DUF72 domain-containing protein [Bradyrhizobium tropiciagri]
MPTDRLNREDSSVHEKASGAIHIGIGGWTYEPWRGSFYPEGLVQKRELEYASRKVTSIEINGTYYGSQKPESFAKWRDEAPDGFVFSLKGPRFTTNRRVLAEAGGSIERFFRSGVTQLKDKLGPINWQFAPNKQFDPDDFGAFLKLLPASVDGLSIRHVVEVRHESFRSPDFIALACEHDVGIVIAADSEYPQIADVTTSFVYARIMGTTENEELGYSHHDLNQWSQRAKTWAAGGIPQGLKTVAASPPDVQVREVFLYVISGFKQRNPAAAISLIERVG